MLLAIPQQRCLCSPTPRTWGYGKPLETTSCSWTQAQGSSRLPYHGYTWMAITLRNHLTRNLQHSDLLKRPENLATAAPISCKANYLLRLFWSLCLWQYLCCQPFSLFEVLFPAQNLLCSLTSYRFNLLSTAWHHCGKARWIAKETKENPNHWEVSYHLPFTCHSLQGFSYFIYIYFV